MKKNCWEFMQCGRETGGKRVEEMGVCPASTHNSARGINNGTNGGRICWAVVGTICKGKVQGTFVEKFASCRECEFYKKVKEEEGSNGFRIFLPS